MNAQQQKFITEYLKCFNATQAAIAAGYSKDTAYSQGSRLLKHVEVSSEIQRRLDEHAMTADEVLYHLAEIARGDVGLMVGHYGQPDMEIARENGVSGLIKRIKTRTITTDDAEIHETEIEPYDRLKALDLLGKYHNLTNHIKIDDWQSQAIDDIKAGKIPFDALAEAFDIDLATELFTRAGVPISP